MQRALAAVALIVLCCAACATVGKAPADARLVEAQKAFDEGKRLQAAGKYAEAVPLAERAVALREAVLGGTHPEVATCLDLLGDALRRQGGYARAEPLYERALAIREAALGKNHPDVAKSLNNLAILYWSQGLYARAQPLYERALAIREAALGKNHPDVAKSSNNLAILYQDQGLYARAEPLLERALAIQEESLGKNHPDVASALNNLASLYDAQGLYARAEPLLERALAIYEAALGKSHPDVARSLNNLAILYTDQGLYARAEPLLERALVIREESLGKNHPDVAKSLKPLANLYANQGLYARAAPLYERALAIYEAALGKNHPDVADSINDLAILYKQQGLYARAELLYERALAIREAALGKNHPDVAQSLNNLAILYGEQGLHARAEPLFERALTIREAALGKSHPDVAQSLNNLANLYYDQGLYARAEPLHERALTIREAALGKNHPDVARSLNNLAILYTDQGLYARAEPLFERALAIREAALGKSHPDVALSLNALANLYVDQGLYARAEPLFERALAIREAGLGKNHPNVATSLNDFAHLRLAQQRVTEALPLFERAFTASEEHLRQEVFGFSEARLASVLNLLRADEERLHALVRTYPDDARVRRLALSAALLRKGRSVEEITDTSRIVSRSLDQAGRASFERLRALRTQLATLSLNGPGSLALADYQQRLVDLATQSDALEADLARRSAPLRALTALPSPADMVDRVAAVLPRDGALVELVAYEDKPLVPKPGTLKSLIPSQLRYLALVLFPDGHTRSVDLGPAAPIDSAASRLRDALASRDAAYKGPAQALYALAFKPLTSLLGHVHRLFLSPDGQLGIVPFEAFHDGRRFLVDTFDFTYLTSGKDLLPHPEGVPLAHPVVVLADPDFGTSPAALSPPSGAPALVVRSSSVERFFRTLRADVADQRWVPLPGTRREAYAVQRLFPQAQLFLGTDASKERLLTLPTPGLLHIATHGFFLGDSAAPPGTRTVVPSGPLGGEGPAQHSPDPLLRSGLVLAGARAPTANTGEAAPTRRLDDSLVTALELAGLDLWGTQLVVLSACDTGRGDVKLGQGVYGLRRSLVVAGAETLVMSLWNVNDETTHTLMEPYYRNLLAGKGRSTALREAMLSLRKTNPHPHFWAPFITIGRDSPLRELVPLP